MKNLFPIAFNFSPLSSGRHCCNDDLDKVDSLDRILNYEDRYRAAKIGPWSRGGLQAMRAVNIPDGTILKATTMIVFGNHENRVFGEYAHFANSDPDGADLFLSLDFIIDGGEYAGKYVSKDILLGSKEDWPTSTPEYPPEYFQIANSSYNVFSYDNSDEAKSLRDTMTVFVHPPYWCLQEHQVVIELGLSKDGSGKNYLKSIIQPEHPNYLEAIGLGQGIQAGTGVFGDYNPPPYCPGIA